MQCTEEREMVKKGIQ